MNHHIFPFQIEPMQPVDIPEVVAIEQASYSMTWPARAYDYELNKNELAHYFVLRMMLPISISTSAIDQPVSGAGQRVIGVGGFWLLADEIHINTIAIQPDWRGLGLGEWLLTTLIEEGQSLAGAVATLEVRPSNYKARSLYQKYNFQEVGRRLRYYSDNNEDALILTTPILTSPDYQAMFHQHQAMLFQRLIKINVKRG
jgi:ribosomal-protein-alanine N-acetyltransferase